MGNDAVNDLWKLLKNVIHPGNISGLWNKPRGTVIRIEVLVVLFTVAYLFLATLGSQRRRSRNWFIQKGVLGAYTLPSLLAGYTLGLMQFSTVKSEMYPVWAISLFILYGCTDSITAYSLDDNKQETRFGYQMLLYSVYVELLINTVWTGMVSSPLVSFPVIYLSSIAGHISSQRLAAYGLASRSWNLNKMVADYMYDEHTKGEFVPATMEGCHYLVDWPMGEAKLDARTSYAAQLTAGAHEVIDIAKVWRGNDIGPELKDTCLSFSLFHLLRRRFFGFACHESKERAHEFVFRGLLSENEAGDTCYDRVFRVIEVELAFMYDFFFTNHASLYYGSRCAIICRMLSAILLSLAICMIAIQINREESNGIVMKNRYFQGNFCLLSTTRFDIVITLLILASAALLEVLQLLLYWTSIWSRVSYVCLYRREQARLNRKVSCCLIRLKELLTKIGVYCASDRHYWQHKLGQYSLLDYNPTLCVKLMECFSRSHGLLIHPRNYHALRVRRKRGKPVELPAEVKKALIHSLKRTNGKLTNGGSSLASNGERRLLWACTRGASCTILTWHIATCYCEMSTMKNPPCPDEGSEYKIHSEVATKLSKYCAYLVVSAPKLLPGHHYDTSRAFDAVAVEATVFLPCVRDKYATMKNFAESEDTIFQSGAKLGKQLEEIQDVTKRWKVLADFWAEMMLYVAPSDNVNEHIEQLARGGEFITHLWALLSHAGILERDQHNPGHPHAENTQCSVNHQENEEDSASHEGSNNLQLVPMLNSCSVIPPLRRRTMVDPLPPRWMSRASQLLFLTRSWNVFNFASRRAMLVPGSLLGGFALQAPSPPDAQAPSPPAPEMTTSNEHRVDVPEVSSSTQQTFPEEL